MKEPDFCPVCVTRMRRAREWLYRCDACGFLASTLEPGPGTGLVGLEALRRTNIEATLDRVGRLIRLDGARILDVGCAKGWFLSAAGARGAVVHGIEPQWEHVADARAAGLTVDHGFFPQDLAARGPYDVIAFNDVFEHLPAPELAIRDVERLLKPGGFAVINLPSSHGILFAMATVLDAMGYPSTYERLWQKGMTSPHISYFSPPTLKRLVERHTGLKQVDAFPLTSFQREGLRERIALTHKGAAAEVLHAGLWALSYVAPRLPADIHVGVFRKAG